MAQARGDPRHGKRVAELGAIAQAPGERLAVGQRHAEAGPLDAKRHTVAVEKTTGTGPPTPEGRADLSLSPAPWGAAETSIRTLPAALHRRTGQEVKRQSESHHFPLPAFARQVTRAMLGDLQAIHSWDEVGVTEKNPDLYNRGIYKCRWLDEHGRRMYVAIDSAGQLVHAMSASTDAEARAVITDLGNLLELFDGERSI